MGAHDSFYSRRSGFIPREELGQATSWEFESLGSDAPLSRSAERLLTEREQRAFERGRAEGLTEGLRQAQTEAAQVRATHKAQVDQVLADLRARFAELESQGADQVLDLALEIARQVVRYELSHTRTALLPLVQEAVLAVIDRHASPRIHINPADFELLAPELKPAAALRHAEFIADPGVTRGGCRVETPQSSVDATLETRWARALAPLGLSAPAPELDADPAASAP